MIPLETPRRAEPPPVPSVVYAASIGGFPPASTGFQGPIAGPMSVSPGFAPLEPAPEGGSRVYLVVLGLVTMVSGVLVLTLLGVVAALVGLGTGEPERVVVREPTRWVEPDPEDDEIPDEELVIRSGPPAGKTARATGGPPAIEAVVPAKDVRPEPVAPAVAEGEPADRLTFVLPADVQASHFEAVCAGTSFRQRAPFVNGRATLNGVPAADCTVTFKGGMVATKLTARPGHRYTCQKLGSSGLACK
ncbi:MAG: hypothetical protein R3F61_17440 [Myxococcota bacterium]